MEQTDVLVRRTLSSGIRPVEWYARPMYATSDGRAVGGDVSVSVNSILYGVLSEDRFSDALDMNETGVSLFLRILLKIRAFLSEHPDFVHEKCRLFLPAPSALLFADDPYRVLTDACGTPERGRRYAVVPVFREEVMEEDPAYLAERFSALRAAGFSVGLRGYGSADFPTAKLMTVTPDVLFLHKEMTAHLSDTFRADAVTAALRFAAALHAEVVAEGVRSDSDIRALYAADVTAFLPSGDYRGHLRLTNERLAPDRLACLTKEGDA